MRKPGTGKVISIFLSAIAVLALLWTSVAPAAYFSRLSGLPVLLLMTLLMLVMLVACLQRLRMPGDVRIFVGTRWYAMVLAALAFTVEHIPRFLQDAHSIPHR